MPPDSQPRSQDRAGGGSRGGQTASPRQTTNQTGATTTGKPRLPKTEELAAKYDQLIATEPERAKQLWVDAMQRFEGRVGDLEHRLGAVQEAVKVDLPTTER